MGEYQINFEVNLIFFKVYGIVDIFGGWARILNIK